MRKLFDGTLINNLPLRNRIVRSATWEGLCGKDGRPTAKLAEYYSRLTRGGVGLIISGYTFIDPGGKQLPSQMGIHVESYANEFRLLCETVQGEGGKLCLQLVHAGGQTTTTATGRTPVAPSAIVSAQYSEQPLELTQQCINGLVKLFAEGAGRAREYGFDAVQLHASHGYLINQFLSPLTNRRVDDYGGSLEGRARFLLEIVRATRVMVGSDFPLLVKLSGSDNIDGGFSIDEAVAVAKMLDDDGVDAIEVTGGTPASGSFGPVRQGIASREQEAYNLDLAARIKAAIACPVMVVGGIRSFDMAEGIIRREEADYIAMSRPFIREPDLALRWERGDEAVARCISCNGCFKPGLKGSGIYCVIDRIESESSTMSL
jgi:2,4-dienoyl-CoA reductase-like NADH-dependent reductase (Old Yellow Enzyme family)